MITASGKVVDINNINYDDISLHDLCVSLENINRFCGATNPLLPVAWHCVELSRLFTDRRLKLQALFHEMDEPFISDIPSQVKDKFPDIRQFGHQICCQVMVKYGVWFNGTDPEVKKWDKLLGDYEADKFFGGDGKKYLEIKSKWDKNNYSPFGMMDLFCYRGLGFGYTPGTLLQEITKCL